MGLPPFTGFLIKVILLDLFFDGLYYLFIFVVVITSFALFYLYARLILLSFIFFVGKSKIIVIICFESDVFIYMSIFSYIVNSFSLLLGIILC